MGFGDIFKITRGTKVIITITFSVALAASLFALFYYIGINRSEDPRILKAREYLLDFEKNSGDSSPGEAFPALDSAFRIFSSLPDYKNSFETGVIYNNKSSSLLMRALYDTTISGTEKRTLLDLSLKQCDSSIHIYNSWIEEWGFLTRQEITEKLTPFMRNDDPALTHNFKKIFERRVKNLVMAQIETPRRLSVSLTNKGTIYRHLSKPDSSLLFYREALLLWKENRTAKSNLNVLTGGDPLKPSVIESLFPPDKNRK
jgi:hypothetical protein